MGPDRSECESSSMQINDYPVRVRGIRRKPAAVYFIDHHLFHGYRWLIIIRKGLLVKAFPLLLYVFHDAKLALNHGKDL
jgi:hypothetical protein